MTTVPTTGALCSVLLDAGLAALEACGSEPISSAFVASGIVAWDDCCGTLVVAPERVYRSATFPNEGADPLLCFEGQIVVDVVVLLLRCLPVVDDRGNPPAPDALDAAYGAALFDAAVLFDCYSGVLPDGWERANLNQQFGGAEGGCISVETRFTVGLDQELWCPCP